MRFLKHHLNPKVQVGLILCSVLPPRNFKLINPGASADAPKRRRANLLHVHFGTTGGDAFLDSYRGSLCSAGSSRTMNQPVRSKSFLGRPASMTQLLVAKAFTEQPRPTLDWIAHSESSSPFHSSSGKICGQTFTADFTPGAWRMTKLQTTSRLSNALDILWHSAHDRRVLAARLVEDLTQDACLILAAWDVAALTGPIGGQLTLTFPGSFSVSDGWGKPLFSAELALSSEVRKGRPLLLFSDISWAVFHKSGDYAPSEPHKHSAASLLMAMQLIRDHINSTLLKPREMRHRELATFALQAGFEPEHFRRLAAWSSRIIDFV
jgi:hypothetical protein